MLLVLTDVRTATLVEISNGNIFSIVWFLRCTSMLVARLGEAFLPVEKVALRYFVNPCLVADYQ